MTANLHSKKQIGLLLLAALVNLSIWPEWGTQTHSSAELASTGPDTPVDWPTDHKVIEVDERAYRVIPLYDRTDPKKAEIEVQLDSKKNTDPSVSRALTHWRLKPKKCWSRRTRKRLSEIECKGFTVELRDLNSEYISKAELRTRIQDRYSEHQEKIEDYKERRRKCLIDKDGDDIESGLDKAQCHSEVLTDTEDIKNEKMEQSAWKDQLKEFWEEIEEANSDPDVKQRDVQKLVRKTEKGISKGYEAVARANNEDVDKDEIREVTSDFRLFSLRLPIERFHGSINTRIASEVAPYVSYSVQAAKMGNPQAIEYAFHQVSQFERQYLQQSQVLSQNTLARAAELARRGYLSPNDYMQFAQQITNSDLQSVNLALLGNLFDDRRYFSPFPFSNQPSPVDSMAQVGRRSSGVSSGFVAPSFAPRPTPSSPRTYTATAPTTSSTSISLSSLGVPPSLSKPNLSSYDRFTPSPTRPSHRLSSPGRSRAGWTGIN